MTTDTTDGAPPAMAEDTASRVAGARLEVIPGASHIANLEKPAEFLRLVREFLS